MPDLPRPQPPGRHAVRELVLTAICLVVTGVVTVAVEILTVGAVVDELRGDSGWAGVRTATFGAAILALGYGNVVYQLARWGRFRRPDPPAPLDDPEQTFGAHADPGRLTVLIPSYREDVSVVRQTVLSAALQDYPDRRVVILVDDPPSPADAAHARELAAVRDLPAQIEGFLAEPQAKLAEAQTQFRIRLARRADLPQPLLEAEAERVWALYRYAAAWLDRQGRHEDVTDHTGQLFARLTFADRASACRDHGLLIARLAAEGRLTVQRLRAEYHRLATMFRVAVTTFERKRFVNVSHEPNKAMNLNAYIRLLGGRWRGVERADGTHLVRDSEGVGDAVMEIPDSRWLLTVDADSILTHDYALRLVTTMRREEHTRTAVMQTPYVAVPGARRPIERIAGATTDIMHVVHQGSTHFHATFWVGANALLRVAALDDIATTELERGHPVTRFIQDRTVIEDTESTIDLVDAGWRLYNYPDRMAYSATPSDYGSLLIQRRRWANGGLIILPKLLRSYLGRGLRGRLGEATMRVHYLVSTTAVTFALLILMMLPFSPAVPVWLLMATCVPYFVLYARDLRLIGRRRRDLLGVYALNLLLVPVQLGGVLKSIQQAITRRRIAFGRTPKVHDRTAAPALYVGVTLLLVVMWSGGTVADIVAGRYAHAVLVGLNAAALGAAVTRFVGWRNAVVDLIAPLRAGFGPTHTSDLPRPVDTPPAPLPDAEAGTLREPATVA